MERAPNGNQSGQQGSAVQLPVHLQRNPQRDAARDHRHHRLPLLASGIVNQFERRSCSLPCSSCLSRTSAQDDRFEIHVYEYEPLSLSEYSLETHLNFIAQGTMPSKDYLLPTIHQTHQTLEPTIRNLREARRRLHVHNAWEPGYSLNET